MLGAYRKRIVYLCSRLRELESDLGDLQALLAFQGEILASIKATERVSALNRQRLKDMKHRLKTERPPKSVASRLKTAIKSCETRLENQKWLLTIWRSFGDAIPFLYLDKWAIKPLLYNTHDHGVKNLPGSILGKSGLKKEWKILRRLIKAGVPALLNDLTNCIRHGDICLLAGDDPHIIEVKSSSNTNARIRRQIGSIQTIHEFHRTDRARDMRGVPEIRRVALSVRESDYRYLFDEGITAALTAGHYTSDPEVGMRLIVSSSSADADFDKTFSDFTPSVVYFLNQIKNDCEWGVYFPYTLSIRSPDNLFSFLDGKVFLVVAFDLKALESSARRRNLILSQTGDPIWPIQLEWLKKHDSEGAKVRVSVHFLGRMACELLSWKWFLSEERRRLVRIEREEPKGSDSIEI